MAAEVSTLSTISTLSALASLMLTLYLQAEASREARAKVIAAEGEQKASRALREASEIIGDSPAALQLRYLQVSNPRDEICICADISQFSSSFPPFFRADTEHNFLGEELDHRISAANRLAHFFYEKNPRNSVNTAP
jgi:hypothetical protein